MMKTYHGLVVLLLGGFLILAAGQTSADPPLKEVVAAAQKGLGNFLEKVPAQMQQQLGVSKSADLQTATLGHPFLMYTITPQKLQHCRDDVSLDALLTPTGLWYFPVIIAGQARCLLVVDKLQGQWQAVSLGYLPLTKELNQIYQNWPATRGYTPKIITVFQVRRFYFSIPQLPYQNLTPIRYAQPGKRSDYARVADQQSVLAALRQEISRQMPSKFK